MLKFILSIFLFLPLLVQAEKVYILGDSITDGYGVAAKNAYPALLKKKIATDYHEVDLIPSAISGSVTASAASRLEWLLKNEKNITGVIIVLGGNDLLRGINPKITENNFFKIVKIAEREKLPLLIAKMPIPMNYSSYEKEFVSMYKKLGQSKQVTLLTDFLRGIIGTPALNQTDGIHPNEVGHELIVKNISDQVITWLKKIPKK